MLASGNHGERALQVHRKSSVFEEQVSGLLSRVSCFYSRSCSRFGAGYVITLRLSEGLSNWNEAISFMQHNFPSCVLRVSEDPCSKASLTLLLCSGSPPQYAGVQCPIA